jgi:hypothetical protein
MAVAAERGVARGAADTGSLASWAALAGVLLAALALRLPELGRSLWIDELITDWVTSAGGGAVASRSWIANHSPVYFFLPWLSRTLFGASEATLRLPNLLAGLLLILALWACLRELGAARWAALACCGLAAFDNLALDWAVTARPVTFVALAALLHTTVFLRLLRGSPTPRRDWALWVGLHALCFYLHYTSLLALAGQAACVIFSGEGRGERLKAFALAVAALALLCLPALPHLYYLFTHLPTLSFSPPEELASLFGLFHLDRYVLVPLLVAGFAPELWARDARRWLDPAAWEARRDRVRSLALLFAVPALLVWGLSKLGIVQLVLYRNFFWAVPLLLLGTLASSLARRDRRVLLVASATLLIATNHAFPPLQFLREGSFVVLRVDWRGALAHVREHAKPGDAVWIDAGLVENTWLGSAPDPLLRGYLLSPVASLYALDAKTLHVAPVSEALGWLAPELLSALAAGRSGWLVAPAGHPQLPAALAARLADEGLALELSGPLDFSQVGVSRLAPRAR